MGVFVPGWHISFVPWLPAGFSSGLRGFFFSAVLFSFAFFTVSDRLFPVFCRVVWISSVAPVLAAVVSVSSGRH